MRELKFVAFQSLIDPGFWTALTKKKLDEWKLDEKEIPLKWSYQSGKNFVRIDHDAFETNGGEKEFSGFLKNFNTVENFKKLDKKGFLNRALDDIRESRKLSAFKNPHSLFCPKMITFADLKKYHYHYWLCFPSFKLTKPIEIQSERFVNQEEIEILKNIQKEKFFLLKNNEYLPFSQLEREESLDDIVICYHDHANPETSPDGALGVLARNLISFLWEKFKTNAMLNLKILPIRSSYKEGKMILDKSKFLEISIPEGTEETYGGGWEVYKGKLTSKKIDLSAQMDPKQLGANAVDLNLKLMKWRLQPNIDLEKLQKLKVLLLGSGTLGCNISRVLIGWGVRTITFVDSGTVSYSNPVRQSLFTFQDSSQKVDKAKAAAEAIRLIAPSVEANYAKFSIPMPGHHIDKESADESVKQLENLIESHDVVYLLMDTRESRWLPTVIAKSKNKLVINCALGFDTYMVMRHGIRLKGECVSDPKSGLIKCLGCYFCNDVVAPANSTTDRTLDQQCTVSRPGLSLIASALAVELMVSVLQHENGAAVPAWLKESECEESCLGKIPHQIRGFLGQYHTILPTTQAFPQCTACSEKVLEKYENDPNFLLEVFNSPSEFLEDLTGLSLLHSTAAELDVLEFSDDDDF